MFFRFLNKELDHQCIGLCVGRASPSFQVGDTSSGPVCSTLPECTGVPGVHGQRSGQLNKVHRSGEKCCPPLGRLARHWPEDRSGGPEGHKCLINQRLCSEGMRILRAAAQLQEAFDPSFHHLFLALSSRKKKKIAMLGDQPRASPMLGERCAAGCTQPALVLENSFPILTPFTP